MTWFTRPLSKATTVPRENPASDELQTIEEEYRRAEVEFSKAATEVFRFQREHAEVDAITFIDGKAFIRVNALALNPRLSELCHVREEARQRRNSLLNRRADALRCSGKLR